MIYPCCSWRCPIEPFPSPLPRVTVSSRVPNSSVSNCHCHCYRHCLCHCHCHCYNRLFPLSAAASVVAVAVAVAFVIVPAVKRTTFLLFLLSSVFDAPTMTRDDGRISSYASSSSGRSSVTVKPSKPSIPNRSASVNNTSSSKRATPHPLKTDEINKLRCVLK